jgi:hypothetical protein
VVLGAWDRLRAFLFGAGRIIVPIVMVLTVLNSVGTDGTVGNDNTDRSVLSAIGMSITPVFAPMGIEQDNWPATVGIFTGVFAKEAVIGTLDSLYTQMGDQGEVGASAPPSNGAPQPSDDGTGVGASIAAAFATVPPNLVDAARSIVDPLGLGIIGEGGNDLTAAADAQGIDGATLGAVQQLFNGGVGAYAYLLFVLLYIPCVAATAAIARETTTSWAAFIALWTTGLAYMAATIFYQAATFAQHPGASVAWIAGLLAAFCAVLVWMRAGAGASKLEAIDATRSGRGLQPVSALPPVRASNSGFGPVPAAHPTSRAALASFRAHPPAREVSQRAIAPEITGPQLVLPRLSLSGKAGATTKQASTINAVENPTFNIVRLPLRAAGAAVVDEEG